MGYWIRITDYALLIMDNWLYIIYYVLWIIDYGLMFIDYWLWIPNYELLNMKYWWWITGAQRGCEKGHKIDPSNVSTLILKKIWEIKQF